MSDRAPTPAGRAFAADYRVRFDEAGPRGLVRTSTLLRYAQDIAWRHSEDRGFDRQWYSERGLSWVVRSVELEVLGPVAMGETIRLTTVVVGHRRIWARRLAEGFPVVHGAPAPMPVARILTDWVILDGRGRPVRIPPDFELDSGSPELHGTILRVDPAPGSPKPPLGIRVRPQDLDPMAHVNNAAYLDWVEEALLARTTLDGATLDGVPRSVRLEYLASAGPDEEVDVAVWHQPPRWYARIARAARPDVLRASGVFG